jgi:anti-sigma regulatory factor (Ser/Thr protein kinase)
MTSTATPAHAAGAAAGTAIRACLTVPCEARQVRAVREFVGETLAGHPCAEVPVLLASELAANSVLHSSSRLGGTMTVTVSGVPDGTVRVEVADAGGPSVPVLRGGPDGRDESGRGLHLVGDLSARWGYRIEPDGGLVTWFEIPRCAGRCGWRHA